MTSKREGYKWYAEEPQRINKSNKWYAEYALTSFRRYTVTGQIDYAMTSHKQYTVRSYRGYIEAIEETQAQTTEGRFGYALKSSKGYAMTECRFMQ